MTAKKASCMNITDSLRLLFLYFLIQPYRIESAAPIMQPAQAYARTRNFTLRHYLRERARRRASGISSDADAGQTSAI